MKNLTKWFSRNSPVILSVIGVVGVGITAVLAAKAVPKAEKLVKEAKDEKKEPLTKVETIVAACSAYIPAIIAGVSTAACILGSSVLSRKQQASLVSTYALLNTSYNDYKRKLKELYGENAHNEIINAIAVEKCRDVHINSCDIIFGYSNLDFGESCEPEIKRTFYDSFSQRYFESTTPKVVEAEYHLNRNFMFGGTITVNEFYEFLGLDGIENGDEIGWSCTNGDIYWIDFNHSKATLDDGMEIFVIDMVFNPTAESLLDD